MSKDKISDEIKKHAFAFKRIKGNILSNDSLTIAQKKKILNNISDYFKTNALRFYYE